MHQHQTCQNVYSKNTKSCRTKTKLHSKVVYWVGLFLLEIRLTLSYKTYKALSFELLSRGLSELISIPVDSSSTAEEFFSGDWVVGQISLTFSVTKALMLISTDQITKITLQNMFHSSTYHFSEETKIFVWVGTYINLCIFRNFTCYFCALTLHHSTRSIWYDSFNILVR